MFLTSQQPCEIGCKIVISPGAPRKFHAELEFEINSSRLHNGENSTALDRATMENTLSGW